MRPAAVSCSSYTWFAATIWIAMMLCLTAPAETQAPATQPGTLEVVLTQQTMIRRAVAQVAPSVVTIETVGGVSPGGPGGPEPSMMPPPGRGGPQPGRRPRPLPRMRPGSTFEVAEGPTTGLIFSADGLILTSSFNFARDPAVITVRLADGTRRTARLLARDEIRRLALIRIDATGLPVPKWADEDDVHVGQWVAALGRGFGGDDAGVSVGIVSGLERMAGNAIQTDAKLSPANYGGPLVDLEGRVVGLIVPMSHTPGDLAGVELYDSGIGFAVPSWLVGPTAASLARKENVRRGLLGIKANVASRRAVRILMVADPSPAKAAGLRCGDELVAIDDQPIRGWRDMQRRLAFRAAGEPIALTFRRAGKTINTDAVLASSDAIGPFPTSAPQEDAPPGAPEPGDAPPGP